MARSRKKTELQTDDAPADMAVANDTNDVFGEVIASAQERQQDQPSGSVVAATVSGEEVGHEAAPNHATAVGKKQYTPPPDPFGFEGKFGDSNRVHLLKSEADGAWVIRFDTPPNNMEGYSKENPHPVIQMLKDEGYRWGFDSNDGKGGWGKHFNGDAYGQDHIDARRVLAKAAEMVGAPKQQEIER